MHCFVGFCVMFGAVAMVLGRPQQDTAVLPSSTTTAAPATTQSPAYIACLANCPTTSEYNPVCGSDRNNYNNGQKLDCANFCGPRVNVNWTPVQRTRLGTCQPQ